MSGMCKQNSISLACRIQIGPLHLNCLK